MTSVRIIVFLIAAGLILNMVSCGTILYPERKGQAAGPLDPVVVILDGIGLIFFLVPGVIAFAVDFNNGTIYLPQSRRSDADEPASGPSIRTVHAERTIDQAYLERLLREEAGIEVDIADRKTIARRAESLAAARRAVRRFGEAAPIECR